MKSKAIGIILLMLVVFAVAVAQSNYSSFFVSKDTEPEQIIAVEPSLPTRLSVPSLGISAPVIQVGVNSKGEMGIPSEAESVAWYKYGPKPGAPGNAVISGHYDTKEVQYAVFHYLENLKTGDIVEITDDTSRVFRFRVIEKRIYDYDDPATEVFVASSTGSFLNLITCDGEWLPEHHLYNQRVVVFTELVN